MTIVLHIRFFCLQQLSVSVSCLYNLNYLGWDDTPGDDLLHYDGHEESKKCESN